MSDQLKSGESPGSMVTVESSPPSQDGSWFPWSFYVIEVTQLLGILGLPLALLPTATKALASVSTNSSGGEVDKATRSFLKKARALSSSQRRNACVLCSAGVRNCNGRALRVTQDDNGMGTSFRDDPDGWIRNGLWCLDDEVLPMVDSQIVGGGFVQCSMLEFESNLIGLQKQDAKIVPWVYVGTGSYRKDLERWRAGFWFRDIRDGYELNGPSLSQRWLRMCPGASVPDPVFRFLATPNAELRREAELFMRRIGGADQADSSSSQITRPSQFQYGPWYGSQEELRNKLTGLKRKQITGRIWSERNPDGNIWKHPGSQPKSRDAEFWFLHEADLRKAEGRED